jgi:hypothetical protein
VQRPHPQATLTKVTAPFGHTHSITSAMQTMHDIVHLPSSFGEEGMQLQSIKIQARSKNSKCMFEF